MNDLLPKVSIVILNWNNYPETSNCLEKIRKLTYPNYRIIIVDNGSTDGSGKQLAEQHSYEVIFNDENVGFAAGANVGIEKALSEGSEYVLLLNNDAYPKNDFLTPLVDSIQKRDHVAIVGPIQYDFSGNIFYAGADLNEYTITSRIYNKPISMEECYQTDWVSGGAMLISSKFIESHGKLEESFFFGMEDVEMSYRARKQGWKTLVVPTAKVYHKVGGSAGNSNAFRYYHSTRNRLVFIDMYLTNIKLASATIFFIITRFIRLFQWMLLNDSPVKKFSAITKGVLDYIQKNPHRKPEFFE